MALRDVKPFNDRQWAEIQEMMKNGPSPEQKKKLKEIQARGWHIPIE